MAQVDKFNKAIEKINNINPKIYQELYDNVYKHNLDINNVEKFKTLIRKYLNLVDSLNRYSHDYWLKRGWSILETKTFLYNNPKSQKLKSPFSVEHWTEKGHSIEDAEYKRNSFRPIRKEYWLERGFDEETSVKKALETKDTNNKKGATAVFNKDISDFKFNTPRCKEYWLIKGFSEADAIKEIAKVQSTFSLEKCINKHGIDEGTKIWQTRQDKWQNTLKSKSPSDIEDINRKKSNLMSIRSLWKNEINCKGMLYVLDIGNNKIKIGITTVGVLSRYNNLFYKELKLYNSTITHCFQIEQILKRTLKKYRIKKSDAIKGFGWTETFNKDSLKSITDFCDYYINAEIETTQLFKHNFKLKYQENF